jgi:hypothetical protein
MTSSKIGSGFRPNRTMPSAGESRVRRLGRDLPRLAQLGRCGDHAVHGLRVDPRRHTVPSLDRAVHAVIHPVQHVSSSETLSCSVAPARSVSRAPGHRKSAGPAALGPGGYHIYRRAKRVITEWGAVNVVRGRSVQLVWARSTEHMVRRCSSEASARRLLTQLVRQRTEREHYERLPVGARIIRRAAARRSRLRR